jgi:GT2 family glycosyltransferase
MAIPARHKMRFQTGKLLLREIAARTLEEPLAQAKRGFSPPVAKWLQGALGDQVRDMLAAPVVRRRGVFDPVAVERVLWRCLQGDGRLVPAVMMLYSFETWAQRWLDGEGLEPERAAVLAGQSPDGPAPDLSVVIVNWNTRELIRNCLASLARHLLGVDHEVIVVDNASHDGSPEMIAADFPDVRLIRNAENVGFGAANNQAMRLARGKWFLLLNSDTELVDDSVARLFARVRTAPGLGVAHCRLRFPDGRLQHSAYRFPSVRLALFEGTGIYKLLPRRAGAILLGGYWDYEDERDVDWVAGAFMLLPREVFAQTGGFDERLFMYGEDLEWCYRIRDLGWRIRYYPDAALVHVDHASSEIRWGDERVALCLRRQRDIYAERRGDLRATVLMAIGVVSTALRTGYYAARIAAGGPRSDAYRQMQRHQRSALRIMLSLTLNRR